MIIGKLYLLKQYCWFLFPTKEVAVWADEKAWGAWRRTSSAAKSAAKWLSDHYNCNASVIEENIYVVLLYKLDNKDRLQYNAPQLNRVGIL